MARCPTTSNASCDIKVASSTLANRSASLTSDEVRELYNLIELSRIDSRDRVESARHHENRSRGLHRASEPHSVRDLVREAVNAMKPTMAPTASTPSCQRHCRVNVDSLLIARCDKPARQRDSTLADDGVITVEARREMRR